MKFTLVTFLGSVLTVVVLLTVLLASCNDASTTSRQTRSEHRPTPTSTRVSLPAMDLYETGIVAPAWSRNAYSDYKSTFYAIKQAINPRWVELPILLQQASSISTHVDVSPNQVTPQSLEAGIRSAHAQGLRVFVVPLMSVQVQDDWAGTIVPTDTAAWFASYWHAFQPYVNVARHAQADQLAIGTEMNWLQNNADPALWEHLITEVTSVYHGRLTYDSNWSEIYKPVPIWMHDTRLDYIGVSTYIDLVTSATYVDPALLPAMWKTVIQSQLDTFALATGKPILISEIGYRDTSDALYHTWSTTSNASISQGEQAGAFDAALTDIRGDSHIMGFFPWGWSNVGNMTVKGMQAARVIRRHYQSM